MKKVFCSFIFMFLLCMMFSINVHAETVTLPDDSLTEVVSSTTSENWVQTFFYRLNNTTNYMFLYDKGKSVLYYIQPHSGTIGRGFNQKKVGAADATKVTIYTLDCSLLSGIKYDVYVNSITIYNPVFSIPVLEFDSYDSMIAFLNQYGSFDALYKDNASSGEEDENKLPMLHYKMSSKNVVSFPNIIDKKISIDWDFSSIEPYASDPMSYAVEIFISANFYPNSEGQRICWDASNSSINESCKRILSAERSLLEKPYSFIYLKEGDALYKSTNHIFATDELQDGYYLYIRSYSKDGTKSSNYKVYKCTTGGTSGQMDITYDTEGNEHPLEDEDRDENGDYSNEYDSDSSSSADTDPTGDSYDGNGGYSFDTLYGNLNSMVNMLQGVPELWMHVMSWLPSWFPTFIVTMMGLLVVIGVLKYIF